jgi:hypothetical protein
MQNKLWLQNTNDKAMELLLGALALIMCKKVPIEIGISKIE